MGYGLSYSGEDHVVFADGSDGVTAPETSEDRKRRQALRADTPVAQVRQKEALVADRVGHQFLTKVVEAIGLVVRLGAQLVRTAYQRTKQDRAESEPDARIGQPEAETDVRTVLRAKVDAGVDQFVGLSTQLAHKLSPTRALRRGRTALRASVDTGIEGIAARSSQLIRSIGQGVPQLRDTSVPDVRIAPIWWPESTPDVQEQVSEPSPDVRMPAPEPERITLPQTPEPKPALRTRLPQPEPETPMQPSEPASAPPPKPSVAALSSVKSRDLPVTVERRSLSASGSTDQGDDANRQDAADPGEASAFFRWSFLPAFVRPRETQLLSVLGRVSHGEMTEISPPDERPAEPEQSVALERLHKILRSDVDTAPTTDESGDSPERHHRDR